MVRQAHHERRLGDFERRLGDIEKAHAGLALGLDVFVPMKIEPSRTVQGNWPSIPGVRREEQLY